MFSIIISEKGGAERRETFEQDEVTIGRVQGNDLMLPKGNVSKRHCRVIRQNGRFLVADQESTNGTYVNRRRIAQATVVREGDRIYVGDFILRIESEDSKLAQSPPALVDLRKDSPPRPQLATAPDSDGLLGAATVQSSGMGPGPRSTPEATARSSRESDAGLELMRLVSVGTRLAQRVAAAIEPRLLERPDATLERRLERLVDDTLNELVIEGDLPQGIDEARVKAAVVAELVALGPLHALLADDSVQEISVTGAGQVSVRRAGRKSGRELPFFLPESVPRALVRLCRQAGVDPVEAEGVLRVSLGLGFDLVALGPALVKGTSSIGLVRRESVSSSLDDLVRSGAISRTMATFLRHCLSARLNLLVVGAPRSGVDEVIAALAAGAEGDRVLAVGSDGATRSYEQVIWLDLPEERVEAALHTAAGLLDHRLLVDGLSGKRAFAVSAAIAEGTQGALIRLNARSIERGLARLCTDMSLERPGVTPFVAAEALISTFDLAIEVARLPDGRSRVLRIAELERGEDTLIKGTDVFEFAIERTATGGSIEGTFRASGHAPAVAAELRHQGIHLDPASFSRPPTSDDRR